MKGHMQDGKFHPHTEYKKGIRKSRDQKEKTKGVVIRKARLEPSDIFLRFMKENPKFSAVSGYDKLKDHPKVFRNSAGSFTQALWDGDIEKAIQRADPINKKALEKILFERKARDTSKGLISFRDSIKLGNSINILAKIESDYGDNMDIKLQNKVHDARNLIADVIMSNEVDTTRMKKVRKARFTDEDKQMLKNFIHEFGELTEELESFKAINDNEKQTLMKTKEILMDIGENRLDKLEKPELESGFRIEV